MPSTGDPKRLPKLTQDEKKLLKHHKGCLKCRCFYANHDTGNCKNNYPNPYMLSPLTQEAAVAARARHDRDANESAPGIGGYFGVTPPLSSSESSEWGKDDTNTFISEFQNQNLFEDAEETHRREIALQRVAVFVKKFVWTVSGTRGLPDTVANASGRICVFGSCGLGIHSPGDDLDILCVVTKHFSRDDFFTVFKRMLRKVKGVSGIMGMPDAFVPVIKAKISGIPLNISMACLAISDDMSLDDVNLLRDLDEKCLRSMNAMLGSPVWMEICEA